MGSSDFPLYWIFLCCVKFFCGTSPYCQIRYVTTRLFLSDKDYEITKSAQLPDYLNKDSEDVFCSLLTPHYPASHKRRAFVCLAGLNGNYTYHFIGLSGSVQGRTRPCATSVPCALLDWPNDRFLRQIWHTTARVVKKPCWDTNIQHCPDSKETL